MTSSRFTASWEAVPTTEYARLNKITPFTTIRSRRFGVVDQPSASLRKRLFRCLYGRRTHGIDAIGRGCGDRRAHHQARLVCRPWPAPMHGGAVVPHHDVAFAP